jgi:hypothetical protein
VDYVRVYETQKPDSVVMAAEPIVIGSNGTGTTKLELKASRRTGFVYLGCSSAVPGTRCEVDTGNALNASVVDLRGREEATAVVKVIGSTANVIVTALPMGGGQGELRVEVRRKSSL